MRWRYWLDEPSSGVRNMAVDHALAEVCADTGVGVLRFYRWSTPTISFGRNEPSRGLYGVSNSVSGSVNGSDGNQAHSEVTFVRRPTGGRAVLHDAELTYALVCPLDDLDGLRTLYRRVNEGLVKGLRLLGADVEMHQTNARAPGPTDGPCFQTPVSDEVTWSGKKLVGSAQVRLGRAVLQHGSLIVAGDQAMVSRLKGDEPDQQPATLAELLDQVPSWKELSEALMCGVAEVMGGDWTTSVMSKVEASAASRWESRYGSDEWTWRM